MLTAAVGVAAAAALTLAIQPVASAATPFRVLAFYSGTWDAAHIDFVKEARPWFEQQGPANGYTFESTNDWNRLSNLSPSQYQVIMFLDDAPHGGAERSGFQRYMDGGGAWLGFHVSAFTQSSGDWPWYYNTLLGSGNFVTNSWLPTAETLRVGNRDHPSMAGLPATIQSSVSEWYAWSNDLRQNPNIDILASIDPSSFPVGTEAVWNSGFFPIIWTNKKYKMLYANFGHNGMNYATNTRTSSTFASAQQNQWMLQGLKWLGGNTTTPPTTAPPTTAPPTTPPTTGPISPTTWYSVINKGNSKCVDSRGAVSANGTVIQQYACNNSNAQQFQFQWTNGPYLRVNNRANTAESWDVSNRSTADNAGIQLWAYGGGTNQQWQAVQETGGYWHFVNMSSQKCLTASGSGDGTQLTQVTCTGVASQSFRLQQQP
jgi:hypothetical protein